MEWNDEGFMLEAAPDQAAGSFRVRYRCPWCSEISNGTAPSRAMGDGTTALVLSCGNSNCRKASLATVNLLPGGGTIPLQIHPNPSVQYEPPGVPEDIAEDFEEALNSKLAGFRYGATVVARRALQAAIVSKLEELKIEPERDLVDQINQLDDETLQKKLKMAAHHARLIANGAAHGREVTEDEANEALDLIAKIFHDLYELPYQLAEAAKKRTIPAKHMPK